MKHENSKIYNELVPAMRKVAPHPGECRGQIYRWTHIPSCGMMQWGGCFISAAILTPAWCQYSQLRGIKGLAAYEPGPCKCKTSTLPQSNATSQKCTWKHWTSAHTHKQSYRYVKIRTNITYKKYKTYSWSDYKKKQKKKKCPPALIPRRRWSWRSSSSRSCLGRGWRWKQRSWLRCPQQPRRRWFRWGKHVPIRVEFWYGRHGESQD